MIQKFYAIEFIFIMLRMWNQGIEITNALSKTIWTKTGRGGVLIQEAPESTVFNNWALVPFKLGNI